MVKIDMPESGDGVSPGHPRIVFHKRSASSPYLNPEGIISGDMPPTAPGHRRSASDSIASLEKQKPYPGIGLEYDDSTSESLSLSSEKDSSSDEEVLPLQTSHITPKKASKNGRRIVVGNKGRSARRALREMEHIKKLKMKLQIQKAKLSLLPLKVFRDKLQIMQMEKRNEALRKTVELLDKKKADAEAKYQEIMKEREMLLRMWMMLNGSRRN